MPSKIKIAIITNIITTYRKGFYDRLFSREDVHVEVFCQDHMPDMNLLSIHNDYPKNVHVIKYLSADKEKIAWQFIPWIKILKNFDLVFVAGNPRVLSDVFFGTFCRLINKKIVLWTMAHSFRGNKLTEKIRLAWTRIFPILFVYTDDEVVFLRNRGFKKHFIIGMNNGLDQKKIDLAIEHTKSMDFRKWQEENNLIDRTIIISSARLEKKNNFLLVLKALPKVIKEIPKILWVVIGGGDEEQLLQSTARSMGLSDNVVFLGPIYNEETLAPYMLSATVFIHPSAIGLSLLHAFGYGLPVIVHGEEVFHNPEYASFVNGKTGLNFEKDNEHDMADKIIDLLNSPEKVVEMSSFCQYLTRNVYNVDIMVERFIEISRLAINN